ncbi:prolipoprotein diacylglyceryl transferase [Patescibacteria group bacterium]|nr:prolipoprotein diacylglyceryl transferase [Patescibacteria group bacterium]
MIPYIEWQTIQFGPITLYVWGLFVATGFILGALTAGWMAKRRGDNPKIIYDLVVWLMVAGLVGGRLGHVLFYDPTYYLRNPLEVFAIWAGGLSIYGGFIACLIVGVWYLKRKHVDVLRYADSAIFGLPVGLWIGRIGCFLIHDHPGTATDFFLGVQYPDGVVRHDHGLYLSINGLLLALVFFWMAKKKRLKGAYIVVFSLWYGIVRFGLDFYRLDDVRYLGLTPAQYFSIVLMVFGAWLLYRLKTKPKN